MRSKVQKTFTLRTVMRAWRHAHKTGQCSLLKFEEFLLAEWKYQEKVRMLALRVLHKTEKHS